MEIKTNHFSALTTTQLYDILRLRSEVFVVEQNCVYLDLDGLDEDAYHIYISVENKIVATARILKKGVAYKEIAIGRVASSEKYRNLKLGHALMETAMQFISENMDNESVRLSAQSHLKDYYARYGFVPTGNDYLEDGIPHSEMLFEVKN